MVEREAAGDRAIGLDALRGGAALLVVLSHVDVGIGAAHLRTDPGLSAFVGHLFGAGVWMFFALSGYLVGRPWLVALVRGEPLPGTRSYAWRRGGRILPAYWPALAVAVVLVGSRVEPWQVAIHAVLAHSIVPGESQAIFFVAWTLGLEAVFYVLLPLVSSAIRRYRPGAIPVSRVARCLVVIFAVVMAVSPLLDAAVVDAGGRSPLRVVQYLPQSLAMFVPGMLLALAGLVETRSLGGAWSRWRRLSGHPVAMAGLAAGLLVAARAVWSIEDPVVALRMMPVAALGSALAVGAVVSAAPTGRPTRLLAAAGTVSYGVYLWHWVLVTAMRDHEVLAFTQRDLPGYLTRTVLVVVLSLAMGWASWVWIERPAMAWARERGARPALAPGSSPGPAPTPTPP